MSKIAYNDLAQMEVGKCLRLGDTILTKIPKIIREDSEGFVLPASQLWINSQPPKNLPIICRDGVDWNLPTYVLLKSGFQVLGAEYAHFVDTKKKEPEWVQLATNELRDYLKFFYIVGCKSFMAIEPKGVPFSVPCGYFVEDDGYTEDVARTFNLYRQRALSQLNNLHFTSEDGQCLLGLRFPQDRFKHAMHTKVDVALVNNNLVGIITPELALHLELCGAIHDVAMIPSTEILKLIDFKNLDEDANIGKIFPAYAEGWTKIKRLYNLSSRTFVEIIQGRHYANPVLDISDKGAYVAEDAHSLKALHELTSHIIPISASLARAYEMLRNNPQICSVWDCVQIESRKVYIADPEKLEQFLLIRALLSSGLYHNHQLRPRDSVVIYTTFRFRYDQTIHPDQLRQADDFDLQTAIAEFLRVSPSFIRSLATRKPRVEQFNNLREALSRERYLVREKKIVFTMVEDIARKASPGTGFLIQTKHGEILPFYQAFPREAAEINRIITPKKPVALLWIDNPREIKPEVLEKIYRLRIQELERRNHEKK